MFGKALDACVEAPARQQHCAPSLATMPSSQAYSIQTFVAKKIKYVNLIASCGKPKGSPAHDLLLADMTQSIAITLKSAKKVDEDDAIAIVAMLRDGICSDGQIETVIGAIGAKVQLANASSNVDHQKQSHPFVDNYLSEDGWKMCENKGPQ